jgi:phage protein U
MTDVLMTLGPIRFSVAEGAYRNLSRTLEMRIARLDRAGGQSARQILGEDETIEIEGAVYPMHRHGLDRVDGFRAMARAAEPVVLTDGRGFVWGRYVVERVEERGSQFERDGTPKLQEFRLSLGAFGEDRS